MPEKPSNNATRLLLYRLPHFALLGLFSWLFLYSAWLCDDSYISFRVLQNWDQGEGLSWNPGQRVQAFSHPSWMLLLYLAWKLQGNLFIAAIGLSFALSFGSLCFLIPKQRNGFKTGIILLPIALLLFSKGFIDYTSSGLENPLSFFLFGLLCWHTIIKKRPFSSVIYLLIAFAVLNRLDTILLVLPLLLKQWIQKPAENVKMSLPGLSVMFLWFAFSIFYFGSPLPNTYYAKLNSLYPLGDYVSRGQEYYLAQLNYDPITLLIIVFGVILGQLHRSTRVQCLSLGILLYLLYIVRIGGDFMLGRFFALPAYVSAIIILCFLREQRIRYSLPLAAFIAGTCIFYLQYPTVHIPIRDANVDYSPQGFLLHTITDERADYYRVSGLMSPKRKWPSAAKRSDPNPLPEVRCLGLGRTGLKADPRQFIVDYCALTDPFLARLPAIYDPDWDIGHVRRYIPKDYLDSIYHRENRFTDPAMAMLWNDVKHISQGELWSLERLRSIWRLQVFPYDIDIAGAQHDRDHLQTTDQIKRDTILSTD